VFAGAGILIGVAYTLRAVRKGFYSDATPGETGSTPPVHDPIPLPAISVPERVGAVMLLGATLLIGVYPRLLLDLIIPALQTPLMSGIFKVDSP
jgi:NADH-quinone oxidoreductase subunit M